MVNPAISTDSATDQRRHFDWGAAIAGAVAATAVTFFFITLGSGIGLALVSSTPVATPHFLTLGAIYFFASQAFGFTVGGYLVGRLIGPEIETNKEEEFRAGAHGFVMWALVIVVSLVIVGLAPNYSASAITNGLSDKATSTVTLWSAFALLFGAIVAVAAAISSRWMDDKISFSMAPRVYKRPPL